MIDTCLISIKSGSGGNGTVSGRREKYVPHGGPDGGDGGDGGSVFLQCDSRLSTLNKFRRTRNFVAHSGGDGQGSLTHGRTGADIDVTVPLGTEVWEDGSDGRKLADLTREGQKLMVGRGGAGGRGNARFTTPTNRFPLLAEGGELGEELKLRLDLKLLADVGIVGAPNVGKSTLLAAVSAAKPKVAPYPFTTLEPELGVVEHRGRSFVIVEVPGLLEGAHKGVGLGDRFLRHVERARVLLHLLDGTGGGLPGQYSTVREEFTQFNEALLEKPHVVVVNKMDLPGATADWGDSADRPAAIHAISAAQREGLSPLLDGVLQALDAALLSDEKAGPPDGLALPALKPSRLGGRPAVRRQGGKLVVTSSGAARLAAMVDQRNWGAVVQFREQLKRIGVVAALERAGAKSGDVVRVGKVEWEWE